MKYCKECDVNIITPISKCPLCKSPAISVSGPEIYAYPDLHARQLHESMYENLISAMQTKQTLPA